MFRKLSIFGLAGVLLVGGGLSVALAGNNITTPETLVLTETTLKDRSVDIGKPGFGPGDVFLFVSSLTDPADGSKVATVRGQCTVQIGYSQMCQAAAFFVDRGQIFVSGVIQAADGPTGFDLAITGGTGEFENVRGSVHSDPVSDTVSEDTLTLLP